MQKYPKILKLRALPIVTHALVLFFDLTFPNKKGSGTCDTSQKFLTSKGERRQLYSS